MHDLYIPTLCNDLGSIDAIPLSEYIHHMCYTVINFSIKLSCFHGVYQIKDPRVHYIINTEYRFMRKMGKCRNYKYYIYSKKCP